MVSIQIPTEAWRKNFRFIVLLAILGVCSAVAWVLAWHKSMPAREAQEILAAIRGNGIASYWSDNAMHQQWFLMYRDGKIIGWEMEYHHAGAKGAFGGFVRQNSQSEGQIRLSSRWRLSNNAEKGEYESQCITLRPPLVNVEEARIKLQDRNLQVVQNIERKPYSSSTPTPENYLPEGLMPIAIREVARRQTRARFEMVQDARPPAQQRGGQTPLFSFELRYVGKDSQTGGAVVEESYNPKHPRSTVLDEKGKVLRRDQGKTQWIPVSREKILERFPAAAEYASDNETEEP